MFLYLTCQTIENKMNKKTCSLHLGMRSSTLEPTLVDFPDLIVTLFISAVICGILTFALVVVSNTRKLSCKTWTVIIEYRRTRTFWWSWKNTKRNRGRTSRWAIHQTQINKVLNVNFRKKTKTQFLVGYNKTWAEAVSVFDHTWKRSKIHT